MEDQNKAERPSLLDDQLNVLNEKVNWKKFVKDKASDVVDKFKK